MSVPGTAHAQPFYCPYCGEQDLRPAGDDRAYHCRTCDRLWELRFIQVGNPDKEEG
ncbi:MAG TPA: hypothetical protein VGB83_07990 [Actinomycetota bacterium]